MGSEPRILRLEFPPGFPLLNANDRRGTYLNSKTGQRVPRGAHRAVKIREKAAELAQGAEPFTGKVRIRAIYYPNSKRPHDPGNLFPSVKAGIDGIHKPRREGQPYADIIPDDSSKYVSELSMVVADQVVPGGQLVIQIIEDVDDE